MEKIGDRIKYLRKDFDLSQPELANKVGVAYSVISNWENNLNFPRGDYVAILANIFHVSADYLLGCELYEQNEQPKDELLLLRTYRQMPQEKKRALLILLDINESVL